MGQVGGGSPGVSPHGSPAPGRGREPRSLLHRHPVAPEKAEHQKEAFPYDNTSAANLCKNTLRPTASSSSSSANRPVELKSRIPQEEDPESRGGGADQTAGSRSTAARGQQPVRGESSARPRR